MARGISLHIGINEVDANVYGGTLPLSGCVNDANDLSRIAQRQGYETTVLLNNQATSSNIVQHISNAANSLQDGDIFFISYSGHGSSIENTSTDDESDGRDESWVLYNRQFLDDELYSLWLTFNEGVRIFVLSDSCHSGTMLRVVMENHKMTLSKKSKKTISKSFDKEVLKAAENNCDTGVKIRMAPASNSHYDYTQNEDTYKEIQHRHRNIKSQEPRASIILISGCQDHQYSYDYGTNGLFTSKVKETWGSGSYSGSHRQFHIDVKQKVLADQSNQEPNIMTIGQHLSTFTQNKPFIVNAPGWPINGSGNVNNNNSNNNNNTGTNIGSVPRVIVPSTWNTNNGIPEFEIIKSSSHYYYIEIVNDEQLFDYDYWRSHGNAQNSFFSWRDATVSNRLSNNRFSIPLHIWNQLRENSTLYVRIGTTSSSNESEWADHVVSESAESDGRAPSMQITSSAINNNNPGGNTNNTNNPSGDGHHDSLEELTGSVGSRGDNNPDDVLLVQSLLNRVPISEGGPASPLEEDGRYGSRTRNAITIFQRKQDASATGRIAPNGITFVQLKLKSGLATLCRA